MRPGPTVTETINSYGGFYFVLLERRLEVLPTGSSFRVLRMVIERL